MPPKNVTGLNVVGHHTLNNTFDSVDPNNSTINSTTYGHQFGKTCYYDSNYFMCFVLI